MPVNFDNSHPEVDLLDRQTFANQIGESIVINFSNDHDCMVFGLNGNWGSGKSTLMGFIKDAIEKNSNKHNIKYLAYEFNPWMFSGQENLQREFLEGLLEIFKIRFKKRKALINWIEKRLQYLKFVKWIPKYGEDSFQTLEKIVKGIHASGPIKELKNHVDKVLVEENTRLFIFLDDIDRLSPDETIEIFQLVKLNTNFKNTFFIIAYDRDIVENSLQLRFSKNSIKYLEKIIQVDYKVPEILPEKRMQIFFHELEKFVKEKEIEIDKNHIETLWKYRGFSNFFKNLRDIYRYFNALYFRLPHIWKNVDVSDFLLLEALRIFDYSGYEKLYNFENYRRVLNTEVAGKEELDLSSFLPNTQKIIKILLQFERDHSYIRDESKSFSDPRCRDRYFSLQISTSDLSVEDFEQFLISQNKQILLQQISKNGRLSSFWNHLSDLHIFNKLGLPDYKNLFNEIIIFLDNNDELKNYASAAFFTISDIIKNSSDYFKTLKLFLEQLTKNRSRVSFTCFVFIHWILEDYEKDKAKENEVYLNFMSKYVPELQKVREKYLEDGYSYLLSPSAWKNPPYAAELFMKDYSENRPEKYKTDLERLLKDDEALLGLLTKLVFGYDDSGNPRRINDYYKWILPEPLNHFFLKRLDEVFPTLSKNSDEYKRVKFILEKRE